MVDIEHRYQPLLKLLKGTRGIEDSLDAKIRQGIDSIFFSIYQVLWDYMLYPYDLDYIIENKKVVKKVLERFQAEWFEDRVFKASQYPLWIH